MHLGKTSLITLVVIKSPVEKSGQTSAEGGLELCYPCQLWLGAFQGLILPLPLSRLQFPYL